MKSRILILLLVALITLMPVAVFASDVSNALWRGTIRVTNSGETTATDAVATANISSQSLTDNGFASANLSDVAVQYGGDDVVFMPAANSSYPWLFWVDSVAAGLNIAYDFFTGGATGGKTRYFPGAAGMTTNNSASLNISATNFAIEQRGRLNTTYTVGSTANKTLGNKTGAYWSGITASQNVTAGIPAIPVSYISGDDGSASIYGVNWAAQTFTTPANETLLYEVVLKIGRALTPGPVTISIRATSGGLPTGSDLTSVTIDGNALSSSSPFTWKPNPLDFYALTPSTVYSIVLRAPSGNATNLAYWRGDETSPTYTGGSRINSSNSGANWSADTAKDFMFRIKCLTPFVTAPNVSGGDNTTVTIQRESPFLSLSAVSSGNITPVSANIVMNAPLWQPECSGSPFTTIDSYALSSTVSGAVWTQNLGYDFDGADDYIAVPHHASQLLTTGGTIEAWIKADSAGGGVSGRVIDKSSGAGVNDGFALLTYENRAVFVLNVGVWIMSAPSSVIFGDGNWYHVVVTWDNTGYVTIYVNGSQSGTPEISADPAGITTTNALTIGNRSGATDRTFDGFIGGARIYNRALTQAEITRNYNATKSKYTTGDIYTYSTLASVPYNTNNWTFFQNGAMPYVEYQKIWINDTLRQHIEWENDTTFHDQAPGYNNDATPTFRTTPTSNISASLISFGPVSESEVDTFSLASAYSILIADATPEDRMFEDGDYSKLPAAPINELLDTAGVPRAAWWLHFIFFGICIIGFIVYGATTMVRGPTGKLHEGQIDGSLLLMFIVMEALLVAFGKLGPLPLWPAYIFPIAGGALILSRKHFAWG